MYSPEIVERRLHAAAKAGLKFKRLPRTYCIDIAAKLEKLRLGPNGDKLPNGNLSRELDIKEQEFIASERLLCKADFSYYATRYHNLTRDPGVGIESGIGPSALLETQQKVLKALGGREDVCHTELAKYKHTSGILAVLHKTRQVAVTDLFRRVCIHRMLFWPGTRAFAASLSEGSVNELYTRDKIALDNLPWWLVPSIYPDVKNTEIGFEAPISSRLKYQAENETVGIATGTQVDVAHLTEVPLWNYPHRIRYSFLPSIPKAISTLVCLEGTSAGKGGFWRAMSEGCRNRDQGWEDWTYVFLPWYTNRTKLRKNAPDEWCPNDHSIKHADLVLRTSPEFNDGVAVDLTRDQLYWWETERALHAQAGETASFLANYPATPQQSWVNWSAGALPVEIIEAMEMDVRQPKVYEVTTSA